MKLSIKQRKRKKNLKNSKKEKLVTYKRISIRLSADFSAETLQVRIEWDDVFKTLKGKSYQSRILYPEKLSKNERQIFPENKNLGRPSLQEMLKKVLQAETNRC